MTNPFFDHPILNSPYDCPPRHWELDDDGQPTQQILPTRRPAKFITPIPKPKKRKGAAKQEGFVFEDAAGLSTKEQQYDPTSIINEVRGYVDTWRSLPNPNQWQVTPETARLLQHWRHHKFNDIRPFFCQVAGRGFDTHRRDAGGGNTVAEPEAVDRAVRQGQGDDQRAHQAHL